MFHLLSAVSGAPEPPEPSLRASKHFKNASRRLKNGFKQLQNSQNYTTAPKRPKVAVTTIVEVTVFYATSGLPVNPILFRLLRIGKLARAIRMVTMTSVLQSLQCLESCCFLVGVHRFS